jgi:hypothetical protein
VLANLDAESARSLTEANAAISGRVAYQKGSSGLAMPEKLGDSAKQADEFLARLAEGKETLGRAANGYRAAINQPTGVVDYDPQGRAVSITGLKGGFR